jgi:hypothetical protein
VKSRFTRSGAGEVRSVCERRVVRAFFLRRPHLCGPWRSSIAVSRHRTPWTATQLWWRCGGRGEDLIAFEEGFFYATSPLFRACVDPSDRFVLGIDTRLDRGTPSGPTRRSPGTVTSGPI